MHPNVPQSDALEAAVVDIEEAAGAVLCPSGLSAVSTALLGEVASTRSLFMAPKAQMAKVPMVSPSSTNTPGLP